MKVNPVAPGKQFFPGQQGTFTATIGVGFDVCQDFATVRAMQHNPYAGCRFSSRGVQHMCCHFPHGLFSLIY